MQRCCFEELRREECNACKTCVIQKKQEIKNKQRKMKNRKHHLINWSLSFIYSLIWSFINLLVHSFFFILSFIYSIYLSNHPFTYSSIKFIFEFLHSLIHLFIHSHKSPSQLTVSIVDVLKTQSWKAKDTVSETE